MAIRIVTRVDEVAAERSLHVLVDAIVGRIGEQLLVIARHVVDKADQAEPLELPVGLVGLVALYDALAVGAARLLRLVQHVEVGQVGGRYPLGNRVRFHFASQTFDPVIISCW